MTEPLPPKAPDLAQRIRNGEEIPFTELVAFIQAKDKELTKERKEKLSPKDVDFF